MKKNYISTFLCLIAFVFLQTSHAQSTLFSDNASNYVSWTNGGNAGTGFSTWDLWTQNTDGTHFAGHFLGSSTGQGFGDINTLGTSFSMYANPGGTFVQANAQRFLNNTGSPAIGGRQYLLPGQTFKIDLTIAFRNGYKGIDLMDQNFNLLYNFNVGSDIYATTTNANLGWTYDQASVFQLQVNQTEINSYEVIITRGADVYSSGIRTGQFSGFKLYVGNTDAGNDLNNIHANKLLVQKCAMTTTWNGTSWDKGEPNANKNVVFTGNYSSLTDFTACSIMVTNNAIVTINSNHTLSVENGVNVVSGSNLVFENNAALLQTNSSAINVGNITYKRNAAPMREFEYTYWGSPIIGQVLNVFSPLTLSDKFYSYNSSVGVNNWVLENSSNVMIPGKGYAIRAPQGYTSTPQVFNGQFVGTPNNGNVPANVVAFNPGLLNYNLLSNPYPSAINVVTLIDNTNLGTLYFWTHNSAITNNVFTSNDYAIRTRTTGTAAVTGGTAPGLYIAAGQGFFASAGTTTTINFTNAMRVPGNNAQFYRAILDLPLNYYFHLNMTNTLGAFKQIAVGYQEDATNDYDFGSDALASTEGAIRFYSLIPSLSFGFGIQARAYPWSISDVIPLGYTTTQAGTFDIAIDHFDTFFADKDIFLEDTSNGTFHNLKNSAFSFSTAIGTFDTRFKIHYQDTSLSNDDFAGIENSVYVFKENNLPKIFSTQSNIASVIVYDMLGRVVFSKDRVNASEVVLSNLIANNQALIIKTTLENNVTVAKKFVF
ncbi:T9SS sorting signal type C domain-containing protein [Flavobacterium lacisediminis]|uniref:T9SS sorting signal type C domain-containing protein n=1 Tax=Flavobacterium lacisediminis TaxID=2989705 RepID=A0ABT3EDU4_9FLAO|nr:T9SS sorting signal type C domain-containing protein [Flavobacterium lacisediminis]MCW1146745.1 T9SS sorting signal type C domain-containing protein [Flavobacterium lacisediminis]